MDKYGIHKDFQKYAHMKTKLNPGLLPVMNTVIKIGFARKKTADGIMETKIKIPGYMAELIGLTVFEPKNIKDNAPCLVYFHGGAFVLKAAAYHKYLMSEYALGTPCKVVFVDYRLAPRYPFPIGLEDCYAAFKWVYKNAEKLGIDQTKIAVGGDSAGGALAAAVTHMTRDKGEPSACFQMLIYPVTDERQTTESMQKYTDTPLWDAGLNHEMWRLYLRDGDHNIRAYASPMEANTFEKLPDAYIEVSEFDCLRDEGILYAKALEKGGNRAELNKTAGTVHGFELAEKSTVTSSCIKKRIEVLKKAFDESKE